MKRRLAIAILVGSPALFAQLARTGLVRGEIVELQLGQLSVASAPGKVTRFTFDSKTWIERHDSRIAGSSLETGELLEVVSDRDGAPLQYARLIHVLERAVLRPPVREGYYRLYRGHGDKAPPAPALSYSGVLVHIDGTVLTLRTRLDGIKTVYTKADTRCLQDALEVNCSTLLPQTTVWMEASKNVDAELEADRISWGRLVNPSNPGDQRR